MKKQISLLSFLLLLTINLKSQTPFLQWFEPNSIKAIVLLEKKVGEKFMPHGTATLLTTYNINEQIFITCEHVLHNPKIYAVLPLTNEFLTEAKKLSEAELSSIIKRLHENKINWNPLELFARVEILLKEGENFAKHPEGLDIAGFKCPLIPTLTLNKVKVTLFNLITVPKSRIQTENSFQLGDDCYFLGFPFGIGTNSDPFGLYKSESPNPMVRKTTIAWLSQDQNEFLLDSFSFPGNSGGPIFKVGLESGEPSYYMIGLVIGHLNTDENISLVRSLKANQILEVFNLLDK